MGVHNRISEDKYYQIKAVTKVPADDAATMKKFGVGASTCRTVRNTADYQEYCERVFRYHGHPKKKAQREVREFIVEPKFIPAHQMDLPKKPGMPKSSMLDLVLLFGLVVFCSVLLLGAIWLGTAFFGGTK